jgi:DMSO/TMAO reductase YedYZ molybdopterin-dependent catalytic subunit
MRPICIGQRFSVLVVALLCVAVLIVTRESRAAASQTAVPAASSVLTVAGDVTTPLSLSVADLKGLARNPVDATQEGKTLNYDGVLVAEILKRAGVPFGTDLRGSALSIYVLASAPDGYQVVFSVGELDPILTNNDIIVADTMDGQPLSATQGPLRIVAPRDARPVRSVRMVTRLDVVRLKK